MLGSRDSELSTIRGNMKGTRRNPDRKDRGKKISSLPAGFKLLPVEPEKFMLAFQVACAAYSYKMPMESPSSQKVAVDFGKGEVVQYKFTDTPWNRAMMAVRDHVASDFHELSSIVFRMTALQTLKDDPRMQKWEQRSDDGESLAIHEAVFYTAATLRTNAGGEFDADEFFQAVEASATDEEDTL